MLGSDEGVCGGDAGGGGRGRWSLGAVGEGVKGRGKEVTMK